MTVRDRLRRQVRKTRRRIQGERLLKGLALTAAFTLGASLAASYVLSQNNFSDGAILWSRILTGLTCAAILIRFVIWPLIRIPTAASVARFLEERNPELADRLATAVENLEQPGRIHPAVRSLLLRDAVRELSTVENPALFYPGSSLISLFGFALCGVLFLFLVVSGPVEYLYSLDKLFGRAGLDRQGLYSITVKPGNTRVVRHADLEIEALLEGFTSDEVYLVAKYESQPNWDRALMRQDSEGAGSVFLFFDVREGIDYFVEADGIRSDSYAIEVSDAPRVRALDVHLRYPRHTGLNDVLQDDGDIRALTGTEARLRVHTDQPVKAGLIRFEESDERSLQLSAEGVLEGVFRVEKDDFYRIHLQNLEGVWNAASDEFMVVALVDQPPSVSVSRPGRDQKVTNLEEVFVEAQAGDDYGIRDLTLLFSVNGAPEDSVDLPIGRYPRSTTSSTTFYLEEFELVPGDFISYYVKARDARSEAATDIYFLEVLPYDREYSQSQQNGALGGTELQLAKFQKEIIAATFNIIRDRERRSSEQREEDAQTVARMQEQLRQQAVTIKERIERRGTATDTPEFRQMVVYLAEAIDYMRDAHEQLKDSQLRAAMTPEQKAYQRLLRAEALFKEIQIGMASESSSAGASADDLADLVDLELDRGKNQYETLQQNRSSQRQEELDDLASRLKELARRQQRELERRQRQGMQSSNGGSSASRQQLAEELEDLARRLEKLSRQQRDRQLNDIGRELKQAARDLHKGQNGDSQTQQLSLEQALDRMQQARDALDQLRESDLRSAIEQLAEQARQIQEEQAGVVEELNDLETREKAGQKNQQWYEDVGRLIRDKGSLQEGVLRLESGLHQTARRIEPEEPEASRQLKRAGLSIRDNRLAEKMEEGTELLARQWTMMARTREEGVEEHLRQLAEEIGKAREALGARKQASTQEKSQEALNQLGDLVENLESLSQRATGQPQSNASPTGEQEESPGRDPGSREGRGERPQGSQPEGDQMGRQEGQDGQGDQGQGQGRQASGRGQGNSGQQEPSPRGQVEDPQGQEGQNGSVGAQRQTGRASSLANSTGINPQQIGREWDERTRDAEQISTLLRGIDPRMARDIAQLAREMRRIDAARIFGDPEAVRRLRSQILNGFKQLELDLFRELADSDREQLRTAFEEEIPPEYRSRVEEYYRRLAEDRP